AGRADKNRIAERDQPLKLYERGEGMPGFLGEADARVEGNPRGMHTGALRSLDVLVELRDDLTDGIRPIGSVVVAGHLCNCAARMHEDDVAAGLRTDGRHLRIE